MKIQHVEFGPRLCDSCQKVNYRGVILTLDRARLRMEGRTAEAVKVSTAICGRCWQSMLDKERPAKEATV